MLRELVKLLRDGFDWALLAECERERGDLPGHIEALQAAARISPRQWAVHQALADYYTRQGDRGRAEHHKARALP